MYAKAVPVCFVTFLSFALTHSDFLEFSNKFSHNEGYKVVPERGQMNYVNKSLADVTMKVFVYNRTVKALNMSYRFNTELAEDSMVTLKIDKITNFQLYCLRLSRFLEMSILQFTLGLDRVVIWEYTQHNQMFVNVYQFKSNQYILTAIQFPVRIQDLLRMQWFGLDLQFSTAVPPMTWPVKVNVTYRISNWYPNSSLFAYSYNALGKWKGNAAWYLHNKHTKICEFDYYLSVEENL